MAETKSRYTVAEVPPSPSPEDDGPAGAGPAAGGGPVVSGYGVEVVGHRHRTVGDGQDTAVVHLPRDTRYKLRLSNANNHLTMVRVDVDDVHVGTMLLNPYTYSDLERPLDRPLAFTFGYKEEVKEDPVVNPKNKTQQRAASKRWGGPVSSANLRTAIRCTFQPEQGAKTMELDVRAHSVDRCKRYEVAQTTSVADLFVDLGRDFGDQVAQEGWALVHWTNAEYDSPVEEVLTPDLQTAMGNSMRKDNPLRKMSIVAVRKLEIRDEDGNEIVMDITSVPRFADVIESTRKDFAVGGADGDEKPLYFLTRSGRVLGCSSWISRQSFIFEVLHKDELLEGLPSLKIDVTSKPPKGIFTVFVRVLKGGMFKLQATKDTTLRELRFQMAARGGPWGDDPCWLFCGTLLEASRPLCHYGIRPRDTMDILLRMNGHGEKSLQSEDPIAVESENPISSANLLKSSATVTPREVGERRLKRRGTTLNGRALQQFIEVDPIQTDERFYQTITLSLVPDDEDLLSCDDLGALRTGTGSGCHIM